MATPMKKRFDGYLPIVVDVETAGVNAQTDALLEIAAIVITQNEEGQFIPGKTFAVHVMPFEGAKLDQEALAVNRIDPYHPFRFAIAEKEAITQFYAFAREALAEQHCRRAVLVGHNAHFDLGFIQAAAKRVRLKESPFHSFTVFDTATLGGLVYGKTVLAKILKAAKIPFDREQAHSAIYDTKVTAEFFCHAINLNSPAKG